MISKNKLIILMGISGSGKSTFAKKYIKKHPNTKIVNMDSIRRDLTGSVGDQTMNRQVAYKAQSLLDQYLVEGEYSILWDNTTLSLKYLYEVYDKAPSNYDVEIYYTERSYYPEECIKSIQDEIGNGVDRSNVPVDIVKKQYSNFINTMKAIDKPTIEIPRY